MNDTTHFRHQMLIASYRRDFPWLRQNLRSLKKFAKGMLTPTVVIPPEDVKEFAKAIQGADVNVHVRVLPGPGFGRAQVAMMAGDIFCPDADYVWVFGSDCMAIRPFDIAEYCDPATGLPIMLFNSWSHLEKHGRECLFWRAGVEHALGGESHGEYMRRLPIAYPVSMLKPMREAIVLHSHGHIDPLRNFEQFQDIVHDRVNRVRNFSESNIMGEWAFRHCPEKYIWQNIDNGNPLGYLGAMPMIQHWSHGGFDRPRDGDGKTPRSVFMEVLGSL